MLCYHRGVKDPLDDYVPELHVSMGGAANRYSCQKGNDTRSTRQIKHEDIVQKTQNILCAKAEFI